MVHLILVQINFSPQRRKERREKKISFVLSVPSSESTKKRTFAFSLPTGRQARLCGETDFERVHGHRKMQ
jgi:hypothetical protein